MNGVFFDPIKNQCIYFLLYMCICVCGSLLTHLRSVRKFLYPKRIRVKLVVKKFSEMRISTLVENYDVSFLDFSKIRKKKKFSQNALKRLRRTCCVNPIFLNTFPKSICSNKQIFFK